MPRLLSSQLFIAMWGLAVAVIVVAIVGGFLLIDAFVRRDAKQVLAAGRVGVNRYVVLQHALLRNIAESSAAVPMLKATLEIPELDRPTATVAADMVREIAAADCVLLLDPAGELVATSPATAVPELTDGEESWLGSVDGVPHLMAGEAVVSGELVVGTVVVGRALDREFAEGLRDLTGSEAFVMTGARLTAGSDGAALAGGGDLDAPLAALEPEAVSVVTIDDVDRMATAVELPMGVRVVLTRSAQGLVTLYGDLLWVVAGCGLVGGLLALFVARAVARRIARPIHALTVAVANYAGGDLKVAVVPDGSRETQMLGTTFNNMVHALEKARSDLVRAERLAAIGQMTVTMNHAMNNPLHGLLSSVELARTLHAENPASPELRELLEDIQDGSAQLRDAVKRITALTDPSSTRYVGDISMIELPGQDG